MEHWVLIILDCTSLMSKFEKEFWFIICFTKSLNIFVSSPIGIYLVLDAITFSTKVEPLLGIPTIKIGFILLSS